MFLEYNRKRIEHRYEQLCREFPDVFGPVDEKYECLPGACRAGNEVDVRGNALERQGELSF